MKAGDLVNIYENPRMETRLEGKARLIEKGFAEDVELESWIVRFEGDDGTVLRWVKKQAKQ